jgi:hypothetical protein
VIAQRETGLIENIHAWPCLLPLTKTPIIGVTGVFEVWSILPEYSKTLLRVDTPCKLTHRFGGDVAILLNLKLIGIIAE